MRTAAKAPVANCWLVATAAAEEEEVAAAAADVEALLAVAEAGAELAAAEVMVECAAAWEALTRTAVAFFVPHCSLLMQVC